MARGRLYHENLYHPLGSRAVVRMARSLCAYVPRAREAEVLQL